MKVMINERKKLIIGKTYTKQQLCVDFMSPTPRTFKLLYLEDGEYKNRLLVRAFCHETGKVLSLHLSRRRFEF